VRAREDGVVDLVPPPPSEPRELRGIDCDVNGALYGLYWDPVAVARIPVEGPRACWGWVPPFLPQRIVGQKHRGGVYVLGGEPGGAVCIARVSESGQALGWYQTGLRAPHWGQWHADCDAGGDLLLAFAPPPLRVWRIRPDGECTVAWESSVAAPGGQTHFDDTAYQIGDSIPVVVLELRWSPTQNLLWLGYHELDAQGRVRFGLIDLGRKVERHTLHLPCTPIAGLGSSVSFDSVGRLCWLSWSLLPSPCLQAFWACLPEASP